MTHVVSSESHHSEEPASGSDPDCPPLHDTRVVTSPFRQADGTLSNNGSSFTVKTGILLWGQILPIYYATLQTDFTNSATSIPHVLPGGTILQRAFTYKSAARNGDWKVRRYYSNYFKNNGQGPPETHAGWVVYHSDVDPSEIINRARAVSSSLNNKHADKVGGFLVFDACRLHS